MDKLPERIKLVRNMARMTQQGFAKVLGTHQNTIGRWERGQAEPDLNSVSLLCTKFDISPYWLLNGNGPVLEKDRDIKVVTGPGTKAGDMAEYRPSEVSGGPQLDATMAQLQARLVQLERERDDAREAELRAKDETLRAKDETIKAQAIALQFVQNTGRISRREKEKEGPSIQDEPETLVHQRFLPRPSRNPGTK